VEIPAFARMAKQYQKFFNPEIGGVVPIFTPLFPFDSVNNTVRGNWGRYIGKSSWVIQVLGAL